MAYLIQSIITFAIPLLIVALAGVFSERSGIINIALDGIMIFGAFIGVFFVKIFVEAGITADMGQILLPIIILLVVFLLNILVKIICKRLNRFEVK